VTTPPAQPAPSCRISVKVVPGASRDSVEGWAGDELKVRVRAPALEGRANEAVCECLAEALGLKRRAVSLAQGALSRRKVLQIEGLSLADVRRLIPVSMHSR
jgi:uncharacterized protein